MIIPMDIKKHTKKYILKVILLCVIRLIISSFICFIIASNTEANSILEYILYSVIIILPIVFVLLNKIFVERTWQGEISALEYENTVESELPSNPVKESLYNRNTLYGYIKLNNGTVKIKKLYSGRLKESICLYNYKVGDKVVHIIGMDSCQVISKNDDFVICGICGAKNKKTDLSCKVCTHHFISCEKEN